MKNNLPGHRFSFELKPEVARKMNRAEYKQAQGWLRMMRRVMERNISWAIFDKKMVELLITGTTSYTTEELIKR